MSRPAVPLNPLDVADRSDQRKRTARVHLDNASRFPGTEGRIHHGIIDAYHGETGLPMAENAAAALNSAWAEVMTGHGAASGGMFADQEDGLPYDKKQPLILRRLAAERLFARIAQPAPEMPGVDIDLADVIVSPYSSMVLLEEAIATLARPGGVLVCPEGYYKSVAGHITKYGLRMAISPVTADDDFRIDPEALARTLEHHAAQGDLCGVLLTLPGNPVVADYTVEQLVEIGRVLVAAEVPVICDMSFDLLVDGHIPIASIVVPTEEGPVRLYDRVLTITGNSKAFNAFGPCKLGAACSGDRQWLAAIRSRLRVAFQRESTHLARATIEGTSEDYLIQNRKILRERMEFARERVAGVNARFGTALLRPLGSSDGMFLTLEFDTEVMSAAAVRSSADLEDLLLMAAGVDCVALDRTGSPRMGVRLNVTTPRRASGDAGTDLVSELFDRIERLLQRIDSGLTYSGALLERRIPARTPQVTTVGVLRETAAGELRVAATPEDVATLIRRGLRVVVEQGAGWRADFTDAAYRAAGACVVSGPESVFTASDLVAWVKPPAYELDSMPIRSGQLLFGFQDPVQRSREIHRLGRQGVEAVAFEHLAPTSAPPASALAPPAQVLAPQTLTHTPPAQADAPPAQADAYTHPALGHTPKALAPPAQARAYTPSALAYTAPTLAHPAATLERVASGVSEAEPDPLTAMSRIAGGVAYREGRQLLRARQPDCPVRALVIGCGQAGLAALDAASACGDAPPTAIGSRIGHRAAALTHGAGEFLLDLGPDQVAEYIAAVRPNLVICAAGQRGTPAPVLLDLPALAALPPGAVVVDLTAKSGGNSAVTRADGTVTLANDITVLHRSNFPSARPTLASRAYGAAATAAILRYSAAQAGDS
ncbi:aminotransferase class I/II-fold pyridoxal phosphate-dependent enzyme [Nocardia concava]|uniref:aminotransferase class I/II-fold pyridoxal phosphate-dependent enzyme n=1 Tax=Nocardia concava TaxID=257281 RepID=UPI0002F862E7|nr:aminotransferase class I/II-fold pyridoxal phosphate-dependent enzyme [Nocardia concava]